MSKDAIVLLSGGIDSTTCLAVAISEYGVDNVCALCLSYGQKHDKELNSARAVANYYGVELFEETIDCFKFSDCTLLQGRNDIEHGSYDEQIHKKDNGIVSTYVPFRNGIFLSIASAFAYSIGAKSVWYGAHADDAAGNAYPDCSVDFVTKMNDAIIEGTGGSVHIQAPFVSKNKSQVVAMGLKLNAPYHLTWSCYEGGDKPCGECGTCIDRIKAFEANGVVDPLMEV